MSVKISQLPPKLGVSGITTGYLPISIDGVTYRINPTQLSTFALTPNTALISDGSGNITNSLVSSTELFNVKNSTSNIQAQLNALSASTSGATIFPIDDAIVDGVTGRSPSQNAVYDALLGKMNIGDNSFTGTISTDTVSATTYLNLPFWEAGNGLDSLKAKNTTGTVTANGEKSLVGGNGSIGGSASTSSVIWGDSVGSEAGTSAVFGQGNNVGVGSEGSFVAGINNTVYSGNIASFILGSASSISGDTPLQNVVVLGNNINGSESNTTYVDKLNIRTVGVTQSISNLGVDANGHVVYSDLGGGGGFTGGTVGGGTTFLNGVTANTFTIGETQITEDKAKLSQMLLSTGLYSFSGLALVNSTTFSVAPVKGYIIDSTNPTNINPIFVDYSGTTGTTTPFISASSATFVMVNSGSTLFLLATEPTSAQRAQNIYLGALGHPNSILQGAGNKPDVAVGTMHQVRNFLEPIHFINDNVRPYAFSAGTLQLGHTGGKLYGFGIGWVGTGPLAPSVMNINGGTPTVFQYRSQTTATTSNTSVIDPLSLDTNGVVAPYAGSSNQATNQRFYLIQNGNIRAQYGQQVYATLTDAIAGAQTESFVVNANNINFGILIGVLSVTKGCINLADTTTARFLPISKFGEINTGGGSGGGTATLQTAYVNSSQPQIVTNSTNGAVQVKGGISANAPLLQGVNSTNQITFSLSEAGGITGSTLRLSGLTTSTANTNTHIGIDANNNIVKLPIDEALEITVNNFNGSTVSAGTVVWISGGTGGIPNIAKGSNVATIDEASIVGVVKNNITNGAQGNVVIAGVVEGLNLSGFSNGQKVYLSTGGTLTNIVPTGASIVVLVGNVADSSAGVLLVGPQLTFSIDRLVDVIISGTSANQMLYFDGTFWRNTSVVPSVSAATISATTYANLPFWKAGVGVDSVVHKVPNNLNTATGQRALAGGWTSNADGFVSFAWGDNAQVFGDYSVAFGQGVDISGDGSLGGGVAGSIGGGNSIGWGNNFDLNSENSALFGTSNELKINSDNSFIAGFNNKIYSGNTSSFLFGHNSIISASTPQHSIIVLGSGLTGNQSHTTFVDRLNIKRLSTGTTTTLLAINSNGHIVSGGSIVWSAGTGLNSAVLAGTSNSATGISSVAEGINTIASGNYSHAEGQNSRATADYTHAEGWFCSATTVGGHAEGEETLAAGQGSHAEGAGTKTFADYCHAEGLRSEAHGNYSHAEGEDTVVTGRSAHAEGRETKAYGSYSHAEGSFNTATGNNAHAEGDSTLAQGVSSHAEGTENNAYGSYTHVEGYSNDAYGTLSHVEGQENVAYGYLAHVQGEDNIGGGDRSHVEGSGNTSSGSCSHVGGGNSQVLGAYGFVHGLNSIAGSGQCINVLGANITAVVANTTYVDNLNIKTVPAGVSLNNLGVDANGRVVIGSAGGSGGTGTFSGGTVTNATIFLGGLSGNTFNTQNITAGENLVAGELVYLSNDGKYYKASNLTASTSSTELRLVVDASILTNQVGSSLIDGEFTTTGLVAGARYLVGTGGTITTTEPTTDFSILRYVGTALSTTKLEFNPDETYFELINSTGGTGFDIFVTGGTANSALGTATFVNNINSQFTVSGFSTPPSFMMLNAGYTLTAGTGVQRAFNLGTNGTGSFAVTAGRRYRFKFYGTLSALGASSVTFSVGIAGTATATYTMHLQGAKAASLGAVTAPTYPVLQDTAIGTLQAATAANTSAFGKFIAEGVIDVTGNGTVVPSVALGASVAGVVGKHSYFTIEDMGATSTTTFGNFV